MQVFAAIFLFIYDISSHELVVFSYNELNLDWGLSYSYIFSYGYIRSTWGLV